MSDRDTPRDTSLSFFFLVSRRVVLVFSKVVPSVGPNDHLR